MTVVCLNQTKLDIPSAFRNRGCLIKIVQRFQSRGPLHHRYSSALVVYAIRSKVPTVFIASVNEINGIVVICMRRKETISTANPPPLPPKIFLYVLPKKLIPTQLIKFISLVTEYAKTFAKLKASTIIYA